MKKIMSFAFAFTVFLMLTATSAFPQDFTLVVIPDPQNLANFNTSLYNSEMQWIANNKESSNIVFVTCVGDLCNLPYSWWGDLGRSDAAFDILDINNVSYSVSPGNHDMYSGTSWPNFFGVSRFSGKSWFGGSYDDYNTYSFFSASCNDFIIINLQFSPTSAILAWADELLKTYSNRRAIVVQHDILNYDNAWTNNAALLALKNNPNLFMMLCGHNYDFGTDGAAYRAEAGDDGHTIHIVMADYQEFSPVDYLRFLRFSPDDDLIYMTTYSPSTGNTITTSPDQMNLTYSIYDRALTWNGNYSASPNDWNNKSNWAITGKPDKTASNAPLPCTDVIIPNAGLTYYPVISTSTAVCNNMTIDAKGELTIDPGAQLSVSGQTTIQSTGLTESGSLIVNGTLIPNSVTFNRQLRTIANWGNYHYFSSPVANQAVSGFKSTDNFNATIWEWQENNAAPWQTVTSGNFVSGKGYNLAQSGGTGKFEFKGNLVTSAPVITATAPYYSEAQHYNDQRGLWGGGGWNLLGNPFTSAMDAARFINTNLAGFDPSYQALYIYDGVNNEYKYAAESVPGDPVAGTFGSVIQAGQGFFVLANYNGLGFTFTPGSGTSGMQIHNTSVEMKSAPTPWPGLELKVISGIHQNSTLVVYNDKMSVGLDPGYDVGLMSAGADVEIYTALVKNNGVNFARQALPPSNFNRNIIPVGVDALNGGTVTFSADVVPIENRLFVLEDRLKVTFTNLGEKSYTVTLPENTFGTGRFFIHVAKTQPFEPSKVSYNELNVRIWTSQNRVNIEGAVSNKTTGEVYDLTGRKIAGIRLTSSNLNIITLPATTNGIYLVKVVNGEMICTKKVVISCP
jgi:hypothetical protein